jgi:mannose-1-phosphate guanylyltransferase/mannose-6-phosphate isomerase
MKIVILAGGGGTRLWPLSRKNFPKQFLKISGDSSLLRQTVERFQGVVPSSDIVVITNNAYKYYVAQDIAAESHVILEPEGRNTAPAVALGIKYCLQELGCTEDEVVLLCPSDHVIRPAAAFADYVRRAEEIASKGHIVTFGVRPDKPETGYGYIKTGAKSSEDTTDGSACFKVERFVEKPDLETAKGYLREGTYFWNSGMFAFSIGTMLREMERYAPAIKGMRSATFKEMVAGFAEMPAISIDYAVMEKSDNVVVLPLELYWNDIGSWDALYDVLEKDEQGNVKKGDVLTLDTKRTLILGNKRHIATIGLEDCLVVETDDAILVAKRGEAQKVKDIVNSLKTEGRIEAEEHVTTYRPWGSYTILENALRYKIKRIVVNPKEKLSLQMHYHRSEHWVVVKGTARVKVGDSEMNIHENESVYVPKSTLHRLENPGMVPLEIIEVQNGEYVGEDDIVRVEDEYGR